MLSRTDTRHREPRVRQRHTKRQVEQPRCNELPDELIGDKDIDGYRKRPNTIIVDYFSKYYEFIYTVKYI